MLNHYTDYNFNFFKLNTNISDEYVIDAIKPAYSFFIDTYGMPQETLKGYIEGSSFKKHYSNAVEVVSTYISDIYNKTHFDIYSKEPLYIILAENEKNKYVLKGEFVLRVINDFKKGNIKLSNLTYKKFNSFIIDNEDYEYTSLINIKKTIIQMDNKDPEKYLFLLDRYNTYDSSFINNITAMVDVFLF